MNTNNGGSENLLLYCTKKSAVIHESLIKYMTKSEYD